MSRPVKWLLRILGGLAVVVVVLVIVLSLLPIPVDPVLVEHGAGASSVEPSYSGLERAFPELNGETSDELAELGHLLFFDPILSENDDMSCASCHHPDKGFGDGLAKSVGANGAELSRNASSLWNVGYVDSLFWDGREESLESQALVPLTSADEMAVSDTEAMVAELAGIPEYADMFEAAFDDGVTLANVQAALAAFERTLVTQDSAFDRYAGGDVEALTASQRRGLTLFRSGSTRCFECHVAPTFATETFRVIGVESADPGRGGLADNTENGAFRVPSLRNVALSAPYMHNGSLATLEEVIDFYADGGGRAHGNDDIDTFVQGFDFNDQEKADLLAFLYALTDESQLPGIPASVPSGLPVVESVENPERVVADSYIAESVGDPPEAREPLMIRVEEGESIQAAVDRARPGDTVIVPYGTYHERVSSDINNFTLLGEANANGDWPTLDGQNALPDGIIASGNNFTVGNFTIRNYLDNGVIVEGVTGVHIHDIFAENVGTYGIYPVQSTDVLVERVEVTGVDDAGIYAGQCEDVIIRDSVVYGNVLGIEVENTLGAEVYGNHAYDNSVGLFIVLLPNLTSKISANTLVYDNLVEDNNHENFAPEGSSAAIAPPGIGILLLSTDNAEVYNNTVRDNKTTGVSIFNLTTSGAFDNIDVDSNPENNYLHDNEYDNNGYDPDTFVKSLGIPTGDILWDATGAGNTFNEPDAEGVFPPLLPGDGWPTFLQKAWWQTLNFLTGLLA